MSAEAETVAQTHPFQAEVAELLRLMVHSVYSEADIFLRELISNASDACDKLRYEAIAEPELLADGRALAILIKPDAAAGTLDVALSDNELAERRRVWKPRRNDFQSGCLWRYALTVGDAEKGAVTHPGARAETHTYADI